MRICNVRGIGHENTAPGTSKRSAPVESTIWTATKAGHAAPREISWLFPCVNLEVVKNIISASGGRLKLEPILWGAGCINCSTSTAIDGMTSPHETYYDSPPELKMAAVFQPG